MILIIGYGNPLRSDDGIGQYIAQAMEERLRLNDQHIRTLTIYQLTPELVEIISESQLVIFIDACAGETPGEIVCKRVAPVVGTGAFTHNVTPESLLTAAAEIYGIAPDAVLFSVTGADFNYGESLSPGVRASVLQLLNMLEKFIERFFASTIDGERNISLCGTTAS